jgi:hypothetical protein
VLIGIACEDKGHFFVVTRLVDDTLVSAHAWLNGTLENCRSWRGLHPGKSWYKYDPLDAHDLRPFTIGGHTIAPQGHIGGEPLKAEASMWRKVLLLFCDGDPRPEVVILARDLDGYPERRAGLVQVRDGLPWPFKIVIAAAQPEVEAWRVAGFVPRDQGERGRLATLASDLSFDPTTESHRLTSHPNDARTDSKRVLRQLCGSDSDRKDACLEDRAILRLRGAMNGVKAFLDEIDQHIVPAFGGAP